MKLTAMTIDQMISNDARLYNETAWVKKVNSYAAYPMCQFYMVTRGDGFDYDRFFVTYQIPEGIRLFSSFGYSSSLTNNAFCVVFIRESGELFETQTSEITSNGIRGRVSNTKEGRKFMAHQSKTYGTIFSSCI